MQNEEWRDCISVGYTPAMDASASEAAKNVGFGVDALLANSTSLAERGVEVYMVKFGDIEVPQFRPAKRKE